MARDSVDTNVAMYPNTGKAPLRDHDYALQVVAPQDIPIVQELEHPTHSKAHPEYEGLDQEAAEDALSHLMAKKFSKCDLCRRSRIKIMLPESVLNGTKSKPDGVTCNFCGDVMRKRWPEGGSQNLAPEEGKEDMGTDHRSNNPKRNYVYCGECGKVVLQVSLIKHIRDVHELSNKKQCHICDKVLSGPFSLKEHISVIHNEQREKYECSKCYKRFSHRSNLNRHVMLIHDKMVVTHKYVKCTLCSKVVQRTSLKKHMAAVHEHRKDFKCEICEKSFAQSYTLKEHIAAKHTFQYKQRCKLCDKAFAHKTNCYRHLKTVHKVEISGKFASDKDMLKACMTLDEIGYGPDGSLDLSTGVSKRQNVDVDMIDDYDDIQSIHSLHIVEEESVMGDATEEEIVD